MAEALELIGDALDSCELRSLIFNNSLLVGFDFYLNGRSAVEVYPTLNEEDLHRFDVQGMLVKLLPSKALHLLQDCHTIQIGFSQSNDSKILYFYPRILDSFVDSLGNEIGKRVQAYYRHQPILDLVVSMPESELREHSIKRLNLYYSL